VSGPRIRVAVVGRDAAAWIAALGIQRALGGSGVKVEVIELPSLLRAVDAYSAVPSLGGLHRVLGFQEAEIVARCSAVPSLGQRFANWSGAAPPFVHAYDKQRPSIGDIDFLQYWIKAKSEGLRVAWEDFSVAASAAKLGRIAPPDADPESLSNLTPGYSLDAQAYVAMVRQRALRSGVAHRSGSVRSVERARNRIEAVLLDEGARVAADFFIDASGAEAVLIGGQAGAAFESWRHWLPCDRLLAASGPSLKQLPAFSQVSAFAAGWLGLFPLQDRTAIVAAYSAAELSDEELAQTARTVSDLPFEGDAFVTPFAAGMQHRPWIGNCVAVGESAIALEPLDGLQLHGIHIGLSHLIALFPVDAGEMPEADSYNALVAAHARNIRDFQIAHYKLNQRRGEAYWDRARAAPGPESLNFKIALFASRGLIAQYDDESFEAQNWASIFVGHGVMPRSYDPMVDAVAREEQIEKFQRLLRHIAGEVELMPTVNAYIGGAAAPEPDSPRGLF
jgi:tryptophan halogenase